jgi:predicted NBD/HSP70 family sugar kinase
MKPFIASHLKDMNRKTVYQILSSVGEISKAEIGRQSGISPPTVIKIIDFFLKNGLVTEAGEGDSMLGRKPQMLRFNADAAYMIGIEYDGDQLSAGIVDLLANVKHIKRMPIEQDFNLIINSRLEECVNTLIAEAGLSLDKVMGIGIGIPGVVDNNRYLVQHAPLIGVSEEHSYAAEVQDLSTKLGIPIFFENDVNAAAVGEFITRGFDSTDDLLYISLGSGLGAGLILNGVLRKGKTHAAGEIGYMVFDKTFKTTSSKAGWLESSIILDPLYRQLDAPANIDKDQLNTFLNTMADHLALCIANLSVMLDTGLVVLGGSGVEVIGSKLLDMMKEKLAALCLSHVDCHLSKSQYSGIIGAASIVHEAVLDTLLEG